MNLSEKVAQIREEIRMIEGKERGHHFRDLNLSVKQGVNIAFEKGYIFDPNFNFFEDNSGILKGYAISFLAHLDEDVPERIRSYLDETLQVMRDLKLKRGESTLKYDVAWSPEVFQEVRKFPCGFDGEINVEAYAVSIDSSQHPGNQSVVHKIQATSHGPTLTIEAREDYCPLLQDIIREISPQRMHLTLSPEDAQRVKERQKKRLFRTNSLEQSLTPRNHGTKIQFGEDGGMEFDESPTIEFDIRARDLEMWQEIIQKPLVNPSVRQTSRVLTCTKNYSPLSLMRGQRLRDLKSLARMVGEYDLRIANENPQISVEEAAVFLREELDEIEENMKHPAWYPGLSQDRLHRLVIEYCGEIFSRKLYARNNFNEVHAFLEKEKRYCAGQSEQDKNGSVEKYILNFLKWQDARDPSEAIQYLRGQYRNERIVIPRVKMRVRDVEAASFSSLQIPEGAKLLRIDLQKKDYTNYLKIDGDGRMTIQCSTNVLNPVYLPIQEKILEKAGVYFS